MTKWIVNAAERTVRAPRPITNAASDAFEGPAPGEFYWSGTYADAMAAGARRRLAEEALLGVRSGMYAMVADRIEPQQGGWSSVAEAGERLFETLQAHRYDVWREGTGLVVLGRL